MLKKILGLGAAIEEDDYASDPATPLQFGVPQPCPSCGGPSTLGRIDVRARLQHQHCMVCQTPSALHESTFLGQAV